MSRSHVYPVEASSPCFPGFRSVVPRARATRTLAPLAPVLLAGLAMGCEPEKAGPPTGTPCPREATGEIPAGDANGDGAVDLADAVTILRHAAEGGPAPACPAAVDLVTDELVELDDAFSLLVHLYEGAFDLPEDAACDDATPLPPPTCSYVDVRIAEAGTVELRADRTSIEAWSLSVRADGCTIVGASTAGTQGASVVDDAPGLRDLGYDATFVTDEGAVSAVVLAFMEPVALPAGTWNEVLALDIEPGAGCECTLRVGDPLAALGEPVESVAVAEGAAWMLETEATIDVCER